MKMGSLVLAGSTNFSQILPSVWKTEGAWERARGLLGRSMLNFDEGLWIEPCSNVHTLGMRYALDLVFLDALGIVKKLVRDVRPMRIAGAWGASATLEMRSGQLDRISLNVGDAVVWHPKS